MTSPSRSQTAWKRSQQASTLFPRKAPLPVPPRVAELIERTVYRGESVAEAAAAMGIKESTGEQYWKHPKRKEFYRQCCEDMRSRTVPKNTLKATEIRDRQLETAADAKASVEAMKFLEDRGGQGGVTVNVNTSVQQNNLMPGYLLSMPAEMAEAGREVLRKAGGTRAVTVTGEVEDVEPVVRVVIADAADTEAVPSTQLSEPPRAHVRNEQPELKGPSDQDWERRRDGATRLPERRRT